MVDLLLDTSAVLTLFLNEAGADWIEGKLQQARSGRILIYGSFVTLAEVDYAAQRGESPEKAALYLGLMDSWPVAWIHSDPVLCHQAAQLKARYPISFADSFVAATALLKQATLVHKDPEFETLRSILSMETLPYKKSRSIPDF